MMKTVEIVHIYKTNVWIENGMFGERHVVIQHETCDPFTYCTFNYQYGYTDNSSTMAAATKVAISLGATEPIEQRCREIKNPTIDEVKSQIENLQFLLTSITKVNK